jgi:hypothetical protein
MKKNILFTVIILAISMAGFAQEGSNIRFSVGAELGIATGGFYETHSIGVGGTAQLEILLQEKLKATATSGVLVFNGKSIPAGSSAKYTGQVIIPLRVGVKYFLTPGIYGAFQMGVGFLSNYAKGTAFAFSPQVGYEFITNNGKPIDVSVKYDGYAKSGTIGFFGVRVAKVL